ncbi:MAG: hypothetical protein ABIS50_22830 [Luteolibacter sp.]|uniref:hypothetical protein n=1 Tax=Luteolibacter sp. TaxID=1962973 RepID=UPI003264878A
MGEPVEEVAVAGDEKGLVFGGFVLGVAVVEEGDGGSKGGGVAIDPALFVEGTGVGESSC